MLTIIDVEWFPPTGRQFYTLHWSLRTRLDDWLKQVGNPEQVYRDKSGSYWAERKEEHEIEQPTHDS